MPKLAGADDMVKRKKVETARWLLVNYSIFFSVLVRIVLRRDSIGCLLRLDSNFQEVVRQFLDSIRGVFRLYLDDIQTVFR